MSIETMKEKKNDNFKEGPDDTGPCCGLCAHWEQMSGDHFLKGWCRRYPPVLYAPAGNSRQSAAFEWARPVLFWTELCGEFKQLTGKEGKIRNVQVRAIEKEEGQ